VVGAAAYDMVGGELRTVRARSGPDGSEQVACWRGRWSARRRTACTAAGCSAGIKLRVGLGLALGLLGPEHAWPDSVATGAASTLGATVDGLEVSPAPADLQGTAARWLHDGGVRVFTAACGAAVVSPMMAGGGSRSECGVLVPCIWQRQSFWLPHWWRVGRSSRRNPLGGLGRPQRRRCLRAALLLEGVAADPSLLPPLGPSGESPSSGCVSERALAAFSVAPPLGATPLEAQTCSRCMGCDFTLAFLVHERGGSRGDGPGRWMCAETAASGSVAVMASRSGVVVQHRRCDEVVPLGWLLRLHVPFISLFFFLCAALVVQVVVQFCRFILFFFLLCF
jgi:hypothetical protein